jgi:uncharacterized membrane-anchored protein
MELKNLADVDASIALKNIERISSIERKMDKLCYMPAIVFACILVSSVFMYFVDQLHNRFGVIFMLGAAILAVGQASMQKTEYLKQLFELKYGK